ncbi:MAG TPA: DUF4440 domain-containing protein [Longimicrobiaceae bacterium]|jgi:hypothetical protein|nr:DUF4440 domain-containing protein [Longimicrobiaceae bacterium]
MMRGFTAFAAAPLALVLSACAASTVAGPVDGPRSAASSASAGERDAVAAQRAWWRAFTLADTGYLRAHTASDASLTLSSGRTYDRADLIAESASHSTGGQMRLDWSEEAVRRPAPGVAVVTSVLAESVGVEVQRYRYLTLLTRRGGAWEMSMAQSTREAVFSPRVSVAVAGPLAHYAGSYRTPRGGLLRVVAAGDSALSLVEPSGTAIPLEPVGPATFEFTRLSPANGVVRMVFTRDATGAVTALNRLRPGGIETFPRVP